MSENHLRAVLAVLLAGVGVFLAASTLQDANSVNWAGQICGRKQSCARPEWLGLGVGLLIAACFVYLGKIPLLGSTDTTKVSPPPAQSRSTAASSPLEKVPVSQKTKEEALFFAKLKSRGVPEEAFDAIREICSDPRYGSGSLYTDPDFAEDMIRTFSRSQ